MKAGRKDRPPVLAPGNYVQWKSRIKRYIDTKPNHELIHHCLKNPPYKFTWSDKQVLISEGSLVTRTETYMETYKNVSQDIHDQMNAEAEASESINIQDLETNLYWEFGKFTSQDGESLESYYSRIGNVAGARETVGSTVMQKSRIQCYNCKEFGHVARECQKPKPMKDATYHREKMLLCKQEEARIQLNQSESIHDTYPIKQDEHNVIIDSLDMSYDREQIDQNDDDADLVNECELLASLIEKLKCEINDSKNRNKFLETSNKILIEQLKSEIEDFKNKNKCLESSDNHFKEANNKLSESNKLLYNDFKKSQAELQKRNDVEYASKLLNLMK
nr:hypothetical protein [Tanacetum cinerariifolium]